MPDAQFATTHSPVDVGVYGARRGRSRGVRVALISPYSWTYPGGVTRHIEALAGELEAAGHTATILAPFDPDDRTARRWHGGARPQRRELPARFVSLGRTVGVKANGAVSNLALSGASLLALRAELASGRYDVAHLHEPVAPLVSWDALGFARLPLVGTYHTYSENVLTNGAAGWVLGGRRRMKRLRVRIAVSEAAAWTARRFYGGEYRIIRNGVSLSPISTVASQPAAHGSDTPLRIVCVAQPVPRKGLPVLFSAFRSLRERIPATLTLIGASTEEASALIADLRGVRALGKVSDEAKRAELRAADVLCAPSLYGESFGMVLTEAFAEATPVVASDIPGYRDVARDGTDGLLVPAGDAGALADALTWLQVNDERRKAMAVAARWRAEEFAWPRAASEIVTAYEDALVIPAAQGLPAQIGAARHASRGRRPAGLPPRPPSPQPSPSRG